MAATLDGEEERVTGLEQYATTAVKADALLAEHARLTKLADGGDDALLGLAARGVADDLALAEIQDMSEDAAGIVQHFRTVLETARATGRRVLPDETSPRPR
ncbi:hypothetical protein [Streptomyces sp. Inha503]|uniref:hypothetical protein n=1 Tax=Streptomyces sp. Inha503 TaxID=3383314 RepID=UPI0039A3605B